MRFLGAALVCVAVLCAFFFDGRYGHGIDRAVTDIYLGKCCIWKCGRATSQRRLALMTGLRLCEAAGREPARAGVADGRGSSLMLES
jgi:hypothetical protein